MISDQLSPLSDEVTIDRLPPGGQVRLPIPYSYDCAWDGKRLAHTTLLCRMGKHDTGFPAAVDLVFLHCSLLQ